jgi:hypothetical protein
VDPELASARCWEMLLPSVIIAGSKFGSRWRTHNMPTEYKHIIRPSLYRYVLSVLHA